MNIAVLLSGGVDSSVALRLLQEQGHTVTAFYLKIWLEDELSFLGTCPWEEDLKYVEAVCAQAQVPLEVISLQKEYWDIVVAHTIAEIKAGRTPNPDMLCNQRIKFGAFMSHIQGFDAIASGHYARIERAALVSLHMTPDPIKDQTYFLSHLTQEQLSKVIFPLGDMDKSQVREAAQRFDLPNKDRKDSQGICFLGKLKFSDFIRHHVGDRPGDLIEHETGKKVGTHSGFWYYTIGQRQGIGLSGGPWYVVAKQPENNTVIISRTYYTDDKMRDTFTIAQCNWIAGVPEKRQLRVKLRHGPAFNDATLTPLGDSSSQVNTAPVNTSQESTSQVGTSPVKTAQLDTYRVKLAERDQGIAPGQYAVFYDGTECLGGGVIQHVY